MITNMGEPAVLGSNWSSNTLRWWVGIGQETGGQFAHFSSCSQFGTHPETAGVLTATKQSAIAHNSSIQ